MLSSRSVGRRRQGNVLPFCDRDGLVAGDVTGEFVGPAGTGLNGRLELVARVYGVERSRSTK